MGDFNGIKFRELIKYIAAKSEGDPRFGAVKLNKLLYFADFNAYRRLGEPITHASYQKLNEGPAPREFLSQRDILINEGEIEIEYRPFFNHVQQRVKALTKPDYNIFSAEERAIIDEAIDFMWNMTGSDASDYSHRDLGWQMVNLGEDISYDTAWLSSESVPQEALEYGRELARNLRGCVRSHIKTD